MIFTFTMWQCSLQHRKCTLSIDIVAELYDEHIYLCWNTDVQTTFIYTYKDNSKYIRAHILAGLETCFPNRQMLLSTHPLTPTHTHTPTRTHTHAVPHLLLIQIPSPSFLLLWCHSRINTTTTTTTKKHNPVRVCVRACMRACVYACVRACVCVRVYV